MVMGTEFVEGYSMGKGCKTRIIKQSIVFNRHLDGSCSCIALLIQIFCKTFLLKNMIREIVKPPHPYINLKRGLER
jgi:hypothetical protein